MLSYIKVQGSPFDVGRALGRFGAEATHNHLIRSDAWDTVMQWRNSAEAMAMAALVQQYFPHIREELDGLAEGLDLPADDVFLWNCRGDLWAMAPDGCTTVQLPLEQGARITHNEDGDPGFLDHCAIAEISLQNGAGFASFVYPASIPGHTFAVTQAGLAMTVNNIRWRQVQPGLPRMVLTRALLDLDSLTAAVGLLRELPRAGGFHLSLAQQGMPGLLGIEFNSHGVSAEVVSAPSLHANHGVHKLMRDFAQVITGSSLHRQLRGDALLGVSLHSVDPLAILADQQNTEFPIYRDSPDDSDLENTMATADIWVEADRIRWQVYEHPGQAARYEFINGKLA